MTTGAAAPGAPSSSGHGLPPGRSQGGPTPPRDSERGGQDPRARSGRPTLWQTLHLTLLDVGSSFVERAELFALELERAARTAARIVVLMVVAAVLGVTAWFATWALVGMLLVAAGLPLLGVMAIVIVANAAAAWFAWRQAHGLFGALGLPATRRSLRVAMTTQASDAKPPSVAAQGTAMGEAAA